MLNNLLLYLNTLAQVHQSGHHVNSEIKEVIQQLRFILGLEKVYKDTVHESRWLLFEKLLGYKPTFRQRMIFEAVFGQDLEPLNVPYLQFETDEVYRAIDILKDMKGHVKEFEHVGNLVRIRERQ